MIDLDFLEYEINEAYQNDKKQVRCLIEFFRTVVENKIDFSQPVNIQFTPATVSMLGVAPPVQPKTTTPRPTDPRPTEQRETENVSHETSEQSEPQTEQRETENVSHETSEQSEPSDNVTQMPQLDRERMLRGHRKVKRQFSEDFAHEVLDDYGIGKASTVGRRIKYINANQVDDILEAWLLGPQSTTTSADFGADEEVIASEKPDNVSHETSDDDDDDGHDEVSAVDDFANVSHETSDDDDDDVHVDHQEVKRSLREFAKEFDRDLAKKIMADNDITALSEVINGTQSQLKAIVKTMSDHRKSNA